MQGSMLDEKDMFRAGVKKADKVCINRLFVNVLMEVNRRLCGGCVRLQLYVKLCYIN